MLVHERILVLFSQLLHQAAGLRGLSLRDAAAVAAESTEQHQHNDSQDAEEDRAPATPLLYRLQRLGVVFFDGLKWLCIAGMFRHAGNYTAAKIFK